MRGLSSLLLALLTLPLLGCPTMRPKYVGPPEAIKAEGVYTHQASGLAFPVEVASFQRGSIRRYDSEGLDVGVDYDLVAPDALVAATVYVYPAPSVVSIGSPPHVVAAARAMLSQREFELRKREILQAHAGAQITEERAFSLRQGVLVHSGTRAVFEFEDIFAGRRQQLRSELYLFSFVSEKWVVKYRFTYPRALDVSKETERLMLRVPWTPARS